MPPRQIICHRCHRCGRRFQRAENLQKHLSKKNPCMNILSNRIIGEKNDSSGNKLEYISIQWDPVPDSLAIYTGLDCPFCYKIFDSISNRNRHIRHYCEHAKVVYFEKALEDEIVRRLDKSIKIINENTINDKNNIIESFCKTMTSQNIIINRRDVSDFQ
jgi:uncharacterized C2H2 Zn-finger protein